MKAKQPVMVNGVEFDALIDEQIGLEATIPEYAVEDGYSISDAIILAAEKLGMTLFITDTPVTWKARHGSYIGRSDDVVNQLRELYFSATPVTVSTSTRTYTNMGIESISISKSLEIGYAKEVQISFKKINITQTKTTTIPDSYGKSGDTGASAGTANTSSGESNSNDTSTSGDTKSSILYNAANSLGLLGGDKSNNGVRGNKGSGNERQFVAISP